jgi:hypothetical protein
MAINLPSNPTYEQKIFANTGINYEWNGTAWVVATVDSSNYIVTQITALANTPTEVIQFENFKFRWAGGLGNPFQLATVTETEQVTIARDFINGTSVVGSRDSNITLTTTFVNISGFSPGSDGARVQAIINQFDGRYSYRVVSCIAGTRRITSVQKLY